MTIGIFYICTGKYAIFWQSFYESCERYFAPGTEKRYYVFTDNEDIRSGGRVKTYYEQPKGFPMDSLLRFDMFLKVEEEASRCDYLFFFNANMRFVREVTADMMIPQEGENGITAVFHLAYFHASPFAMNFEKRKKSTAYIPYEKGAEYRYFMGGLNGGEAKAYYRLVHACHDQVHTDLDHGVIAIYHDESQLNRYLHGKHIKALPPVFGCPEDAHTDEKPYIIILNKMKHGGKYFDKLPKTSYGRRIKFKLQRIWRNILWRMGI